MSDLHWLANANAAGPFESFKQGAHPSGLPGPEHLRRETDISYDIKLYGSFFEDVPPTPYMPIGNRTPAPLATRSTSAVTSLGQQDDAAKKPAGKDPVANVMAMPRARFVLLLRPFQLVVVLYL